MTMVTSIAAPAFADAYGIALYGTHYLDQGNITVEVRGGQYYVNDVLDDDGPVIIKNHEDESDTTSVSNTITIHAEDGEANVTLKDVDIVTNGEANKSGITVKADKTKTATATVNVTLDNVTVDAREDASSEGATGGAGMTIQGNGVVNIELDGKNELLAGDGHAGLEKNRTESVGSLNINDSNEDGGSLTALQEQGYEIDLVDIRQDGTVDLEHLKDLLRPDTICVAVTLVDSELGVVQPVQEIAAILKAYPHCHLHVDATQAVGKIPVSFEGVDTMSLTAHKFYGLNGIGLLIKRRNLALEPLIHGGESTTIYRSGTPTVALASSLACALDLAVTDLPGRVDHVAKLNAELRAALSTYPLVRINSPEHAIPHVLNLSVRNVKGTVFQRELDAHGVCVSVKSACSSDGLPSRAVFAVSHDRRNALSSWRISLSHLTTEDEITGFLQAFDACYNALTQ